MHSSDSTQAAPLLAYAITMDATAVLSHLIPDYSISWEVHCKKGWRYLECPFQEVLGQLHHKPVVFSGSLKRLHGTIIIQKLLFKKWNASCDCSFHISKKFWRFTYIFQSFVRALFRSCRASFVVEIQWNSGSGYEMQHHFWSCVP